MRGGRGQVSVEYMLVIGMAFILLVPGGYLFYSFSKATNDQVVGTQISRAGSEIISTVDSMYAVGKNSWSTVVVRFPETTKNIYVTPDELELVIQYETQNGLTEAVFFSDINLTTPYPGGNISSEFRPGLSRLKIEYKDATVQISEIA